MSGSHIHYTCQCGYRTVAVLPLTDSGEYDEADPEFMTMRVSVNMEMLGHNRTAHPELGDNVILVGLTGTDKCFASRWN